MGLIIALLVIGLFLMAVELVLLPGTTVAGFIALVISGFGVYLAFARYGTTGGLITLGILLVLSIAVIAICLKARTWRRFTLKQEIDGRSQELPQDHGVSVGDRGKAITRLAPMGKVLIDGNTYEAKSIDAYVDQQTEIEVIGFENFNVIVKVVR